MSKEQAKIGSIWVNIKANIAHFRKNIGKSMNILDIFKKRSKRFTKDFKRGFSDIGKVVAGAFAISSITSFVKSTLSADDAMHKFGLRFNESTAALSQYQHVLALSGLQQNQFIASLQRMVRNTSNAAKGLGESVAAFKELQISPAVLTQLSPVRAFEVLAERLSEIEDHHRKIAILQKIMDSEGVAMIQAMEGGAEAIFQMRKEADALGLTLQDNVANGVAGVNDQITRSFARVRAEFQLLVRELAPGLAFLAEKFRGAFTGYKDLTAKALKEFGKLRMIQAQNKIKLAEFMLMLDRKMGMGEDSQSIKMAEKDLEKAKQSLKFWKQFFIEANEHLNLDVKESSDTFKDALRDMNRSLEESKRRFEEWKESLETSKLKSRAEQLAKSVEDPLETMNRKIKEILDLSKRFPDILTPKIVDKLIAQITKVDEMVEVTANAFDVMVEMGQYAAESLHMAFADFFFDPAEAGLKGLLRSFADTVRQMLAEAAALSVLRALFLGGGNPTGNWWERFLYGAGQSLVGGTVAPATPGTNSAALPGPGKTKSRLGGEVVVQVVQNITPDKTKGMDLEALANYAKDLAVSAIVRMAKNGELRVNHA